MCEYTNALMKSSNYGRYSNCCASTSAFYWCSLRTLKCIMLYCAMLVKTIPKSKIVTAVVTSHRRKWVFVNRFICEMFIFNLCSILIKIKSTISVFTYASYRPLSAMQMSSSTRTHPILTVWLTLDFTAWHRVRTKTLWSLSSVVLGL